LSEQPPEKQAQEVSEETYKISNITVNGNKVVSAEEIIDIFGLKVGETIDMDEVAKGIENLESTGWFQSINADTSKNEDGSEIIIEVLEKELIPVDSVRIIAGENSANIPLFSSDELARYFGFYPGIMTVEDIDVKCRLIEQLYSYKNYTALASKDFEDDTLVIKIDAKRKFDIDKPRAGKLISGKKRRPIQNFIRPAADHVITFNRVRGLILGSGIEAKSTYESGGGSSGGGRIYGGFSYGFSDKEWNYQFGLEPWLFDQRKLMAGVDIHKITQIRDETLFPNDEEDFFASAIFGWNLRDYYQREGYELSLTQIITPSNKLVLKFRDDDYRTLYKVTDWSLFRGDKIKRENLPSDDGRMRSIILSYEFDSRKEKETTMRHFYLMSIPSHKTTNGWKGVVSMEYAKSPLGAELNDIFDFALFGFEITRYNRLSRHQFLDFRLKGAIADNPLPLQYKFYLGGIGSLRGYEFQEFEGDRMILANVEYKITPNIEYKIGDEKARLRIRVDISPIIFIDTGHVWKHDETPGLKDLKTNVGIGFQGKDDFRINLAKPIETGRKLRLTVRLKRAF